MYPVCYNLRDSHKSSQIPNHSPQSSEAVRAWSRRRRRPSPRSHREKAECWRRLRLRWPPPRPPKKSRIPWSPSPRQRRRRRLSRRELRRRWRQMRKRPPPPPKGEGEPPRMGSERGRRPKGPRAAAAAEGRTRRTRRRRLRRHRRGTATRSGLEWQRERYMAGKAERDGSRPKIAPYTTASRATRLQYRMPNCCEFRIVMAAVGMPTRGGGLSCFPAFSRII